MTRRNALKAVVAGAVGLISHQAVFNRKAKAEVASGKYAFSAFPSYIPDNIEWDLGQFKTLTIRYGDKSVVLDTKEVFEALQGKE